MFFLDIHGEWWVAVSVHKCKLQLLRGTSSQISYQVGLPTADEEVFHIAWGFRCVFFTASQELRAEGPAEPTASHEDKVAWLSTLSAASFWGFTYKFLSNGVKFTSWGWDWSHRQADKTCHSSRITTFETIRSVIVHPCCPCQVQECPVGKDLDVAMEQQDFWSHWSDSWCFVTDVSLCISAETQEKPYSSDCDQESLFRDILCYFMLLANKRTLYYICWHAFRAGWWWWEPLEQRHG